MHHATHVHCNHHHDGFADDHYEDGDGGGGGGEDEPIHCELKKMNHHNMDCVVQKGKWLGKLWAVN